VDLPRMDRATSGSGLNQDPKEVLTEFWVDLKQLLTQQNDRRVVAGKRPLTQKDLAERVNVPITTFNGWWSGGTVPAEFRPLAEVAEFLDGNLQEWIDRCRQARAAHEAILAGDRSSKSPAATDEQRTAAPSPTTEDATAGRSSLDANRTETSDAADGITDQPPSPPAAAAVPRRRPFRRSHIIVLASAIVLIAAAIPLAWSWYHRSPAPTSQPRPDHAGSGLAMQIVPIPLTALSPPLAAIVGSRGSTRSGTIAGFVFRNYEDSLCMSANTTGATAGANRDKIQLAACTSANDEIWIPAQWGRSGVAIHL
jgi:transcriptional regulator with XRE-family HTH domain